MERNSSLQLWTFNLLLLLLHLFFNKLYLIQVFLFLFLLGPSLLLFLLFQNVVFKIVHRL